MHKSAVIFYTLTCNSTHTHTQIENNAINNRLHSKLKRLEINVSKEVKKKKLWENCEDTQIETERHSMFQIQCLSYPNPNVILHRIVGPENPGQAG